MIVFRECPILSNNPFHSQYGSFQQVYFVEIQRVPKPVLNQSIFDTKLSQTSPKMSKTTVTRFQKQS